MSEVNLLSILSAHKATETKLLSLRLNKGIDSETESSEETQILKGKLVLES